MCNNAVQEQLSHHIKTKITKGSEHSTTIVALTCAAWRRGFGFVAFWDWGGWLSRGDEDYSEFGLAKSIGFCWVEQFRSHFANSGVNLDALYQELVTAIGVADGDFPLGLHDDLHLFEAVWFNDTAAGTHAVLLRGGSFNFKGHSFTSGVGELHCHRDVLSKLEPAGEGDGV
jgi:hypothetical protein